MSELTKPRLPPCSPLPPVSTPELREYEKILDIHKQILAGTHPRLKIAIQPNGKIASLTVPVPPSHSQSQPQPQPQRSEQKLNDAQTAPKESKTAAKKRRKAEQQLLRQQRQHEEQQQQQQQQRQQQQEVQETIPTIPNANEIQSIQHSQTQDGPVPAPSVLATKPPSLSTALVAPASSTTAGAAAAPTLLPDFDPIFLTESPVVTRAKIQLQRDKLERLIHDQVLQRKADRSSKVSGHESAQDFQVGEILEKAHGVVMPIPALSPSPASHLSQQSHQPQPEKEDEGGEGGSEEGQIRDTNMTGTTASPQYEDAYHTSRISGAGQTADLSARSPAGDPATSDTRQNLKRPSHGTPLQQQQGPAHHEHVYEEPEYSPPGPGLPVDDENYEPELELAYQSELPPSPPAVHGHSHEWYRRKSLEARQQLPDVRHGAQYQQSQPHAPVHIQNHILEPVAPRPERVSPLATGQYEELPEPQQAAFPSSTIAASNVRDHLSRRAKARSRKASDMEGDWSSVHQYTPQGLVPLPEQQHQPPLSRKRRRVLREEQRHREMDAEKGPMVPYPRPSPPASQVYVKAEPTSPRRAMVMDVTAEADARVAPSHRPLPREAAAYIDITSSPKSPQARIATTTGSLLEEGYREMVSPSPSLPHAAHPSSRRVVHGHGHTHDVAPVRRVATLHRAPSRHVSLHPEDSGAPVYRRASSVVAGYAREGRPRYRYIEEPDRDGYIFADAPAHYRPPLVYRDTYYELEHPHGRGMSYAPYPPPPAAAAAAAAPRRVVVDQDGNRYIEAPPSSYHSRRYPYPPPPLSRRREVYEDERPVAYSTVPAPAPEVSDDHRQPIERVSSIARYDDAHYSGMPPPYSLSHRARPRELATVPPSRALVVSKRLLSRHPQAMDHGM
ncbi:hypothetical protein KEM56_000267 [Ascosphaera pollenicola]|nr:hypothetical protein KEM56_000267 [Ascosphaera pollenicola]